MTNVVGIRPGLEPTPDEPKPNPDLIKMLEEILDQARAGEVMGLVYVSLHPGDLTTYGYGGRRTRGVLGTLLMLQHYLISKDINE